MSQARRDTLTGSRIRERRLTVGIRQADLARESGISASYLNLIEHNRRNIGGKLLVDIAGVLGVEPSTLSEGASASLITALREAAARTPEVQAEDGRVEEFADRFSGWSELLAHLHRRVVTLEHTVEAINDRVSHDPALAASLYEVLSTATAIRSTASILAEGGEVDPKWLARFHKNVDDDSRRLADSARSLVGYLDNKDDASAMHIAPQEEVETFFASRDYFIKAMEQDAPDIEKIIASADDLTSNIGRQMTAEALRRYNRDAQRLPLGTMQIALKTHGFDPLAIARHTKQPVHVVMRRLAVLPADALDTPCGVILSDGAGHTLFRKPVEGFVIPRFGAPCALWPIYGALGSVGQVMHHVIEQAGRMSKQYECISYGYQVAQPQINAPSVTHAIMLIRAQNGEPSANPIPVGSACSVCPRECIARRQPSILREEF